MQRSLSEILANRPTARKVKPRHSGNSGLSSKIEEPMRTVRVRVSDGWINRIQRWSVARWEWVDV